MYGHHYFVSDDEATVTFLAMTRHNSNSCSVLTLPGTIRAQTDSKKGETFWYEVSGSESGVPMPKQQRRKDVE
jgi:hypothetical protein